MMKRSKVTKSRGMQSISRLRLTSKEEHAQISPANTAKISEYFSTSKAPSTFPLKEESCQSPYKNCLSEINQINDSNDTDDFKTPLAFSKLQKNYEPQRKKVMKRKKSVKKQTTITKLLEDNFSKHDMNSEHLQMALALSLSEQESCAYADEPDTGHILPSTQEKIATIKQTLEKFGFTSATTKTNVRNIEQCGKLQEKKRKKSRYKYITPVLFLRTREDRETMIANKISSILSNQSACNYKTNFNKLLLFSDVLEKYKSNKTIFNFNNFTLEELKDETLFMIGKLNITPSRTKCGSLLRNWHDIPGRDITPPPKSKSCVEPNDIMVKDKPQISLNRSISPDLFNSDDEILYINNLESSPVHDVVSQSLVTFTPSKHFNNEDNSSDQSDCEVVECNKGILHYESFHDNGETITHEFFDLTNSSDEETVDFCNIKSKPEQEIVKDSLSSKTKKQIVIGINKSGCEKRPGSEIINHDDTLNQLKSSIKKKNKNNENQLVLNELTSSIIMQDNSKEQKPNEYLFEKYNSGKTRSCKPSNEKIMIQCFSDEMDRIDNSTTVDNIIQNEVSLRIPMSLNKFSTFGKTTPDHEVMDLTQISESSDEDYSETKVGSRNNTKMIENFAGDSNIEHCDKNNLKIKKNALEIDFQKVSDADKLSPEFILKLVDSLVEASITPTSNKSSKKLEQTDGNNTLNEINVDKKSLRQKPRKCLFKKYSSNNTFNKNVDKVKTIQKYNTLNHFEHKNSTTKSENVQIMDLTHMSVLSDNEKVKNKTSDLHNDYNATTSSAYFDKSLNTTDYVNNMLNKTETFFSDKKKNIISSKSVENKLLQIETSEHTEFQKHSTNSTDLSSSQDSVGYISDEELNYSSHYSAPIRKIKNQKYDTQEWQYMDDNFAMSPEQSHPQNEPKIMHPKIQQLGHVNTLQKISFLDDSLNNQLKEDSILNINNVKKADSKIKDVTKTPNNSLIIKTSDVTPSVNYNVMNTPEIHRELHKYGLKPLKRHRGVEILNYIYETTHPVLPLKENSDEDCEVGHVIKKLKQDDLNIQEVSCIQPTIYDNKLVQSELEENIILERKHSLKVHSCAVPLHIVWHNLVTNNLELQKNILLYEPLHVEILHDVLKEQGFKFHIQDLITFLDKKCITFRTNQTKGRKQKKKRLF